MAESESFLDSLKAAQTADNATVMKIFKTREDSNNTKDESTLFKEFEECCKVNKTLAEAVKARNYKLAVENLLAFENEEIEAIVSKYMPKKIWLNQSIYDRIYFIKKTREEVEQKATVETVNKNKEQVKKSAFKKKEVGSFIVSDDCIQKRVYIPKKGEEPELMWVPITSTPFIVSKIGEILTPDNDDNVTYKYEITYKTITGKILSKFVDPTEILSDSMKALTKKGLVFNDADVKDLKEYVKCFLEAGNVAKEDIAMKNGWYKNDTVLVTGKFKHTAEGTEEITQLSDVIAAAYEVSGNKQDYINDVLMPLLDYDIFRIKLYATVAAYISKFLPVENVNIHNWYESGGLKSATLKAAAAFVGNPKELVRDADATKVGVEKILEYNNNTPVFFDETSNNPEFKSYIYMMRNGSGKDRGNKELEAWNKGSKWKSVTQSTGELPLTKNETATVGKQMGVLEIYEGIPQMKQEIVKKIELGYSENYGHFLEEIMREIFIDKPNFKKLFKAYSTYVEKVTSIFSERLKGYFIMLMIAGSIVERVFKTNNIQTKDPVHICKTYFNRVVIADPTISYGNKAINWLYQWTLRNTYKFEFDKTFALNDSVKKQVEIEGYVTSKSIYYPEITLQKAMKKDEWDYARVIADWEKDNYIIPRIVKGEKKGKVNKATFNGKTITGINIAFQTFKEVLGLEDLMFEDAESITQELKNNDNRHDKEQKTEKANTKTKSYNTEAVSSINSFEQKINNSLKSQKVVGFVTEEEAFRVLEDSGY